MKTLINKIMKRSTDVDENKTLTEEEYDKMKEEYFYKLYPNSFYKSTLHNTHRKTQKEIRNEKVNR